MEKAIIHILPFKKCKNGMNIRPNWLKQTKTDKIKASRLACRQHCYYTKDSRLIKLNKKCPLWVKHFYISLLVNFDQNKDSSACRQ